MQKWKTSDSTALIKKIECPILIIVGSNKNPLVQASIHSCPAVHLWRETEGAGEIMERDKLNVLLLTRRRRRCGL